MKDLGGLAGQPVPRGAVAPGEKQIGMPCRESVDVEFSGLWKGGRNREREKEREGGERRGSSDLF